MLAAGLKGSVIAHVFGFVAVVLVSVNIFGGFVVTNRMLSMFKKKDKAVSQMNESLTSFAYLIAAVLFILALRGLSHPT